MIKATDIDTLDSFKRKTKTHLAKLKRTGNACVLTINGKGAVVIQDAAAYERQMEALEHAELERALRESDAQIKRGETYSVDEAFAKLDARIKQRQKRRKSA